MNRKRLSWIVAFALGISAQVSEAQLQFQFIYSTDPSDEFNDATHGTTRRSALEAAAANYATAFSHTDYTQTVEIEVTGVDTPGGSLMSAGTYFWGPKTVGFGNDEGVITKVLTGTDLGGGSNPDAVLTVNFAYDWELDYNATNLPLSGVYDWYAVTYHEFSHMMGFASGIVTSDSGKQARDLFTSSPGGDGSWATFDQFLTDSAGNSVFSGFNLNESTYQSLLVGGASPTNGLFFETHEGNLVGLFSPSGFLQGSSGSHLDWDNTNIPPDYQDMMMLPFIGDGTGTRTFSDIELEMFETLGYTNIGQIMVVPEPKHYVLGLGFVALVFVLVRRRNKSAP